MKKGLYGLFIGLFVMICLIPSVGMLFAGPAQASANEVLAEPPALVGEEGKINETYLADLAGWINDRFFLRNTLISTDRWLNTTLLGTSGQDSVIAGENGWLYFEATLDNYTGVNGLTQRQLQHAANNLSLMARYCEENGKQFLFVIAPNKNALYDANMPSYGVKAERTDADALQQLLKEAGVAYVDLFAAFRAREETLYFAHDSHWNSKGAALGADLINAGFGRSSRYFDGPFTEAAPHAGDLFVMLYPGWTDPETDPVYGGELKFEFTGKATRPDAISLQTAGQGSGSLLAYRDSFGNLLYPYLADSFATATFSRSTAYDLTKEAKFVLVELVQRNLSYLITYVPLMPSPEAAIELPPSSGAAAVKAAPKSGLLQVTGKLPCEADAAWVLWNGTAYEAFMLADMGFAANLPENATPQAVVYSLDGQMKLLEITVGGN